MNVSGMREARRGAALRLLIVDDSEDDAALIAATLSAQGFRIDTRRVDTPTAFVTALDECWDAILCDYAMPSFGPGQVLRIARARGSLVPLVMVSGVTSERAVSTLLHDGMRAFVSKHDLSRLGDVLRNICTHGNWAETPHAPVCAADWRLACTRIDDYLVAAGTRQYALMTFDVDRLRRVNHALGYACGDELLALMGARLAAYCGPQGYLGRLRGDEFALLLPASSRAEAMARSREAAELLSSPYRIGGVDLFVTVSGGVALAAQGDNSAELVRACELALYEAKRRGGNRCEAPPSEDTWTADAVTLEYDLHRALELGQLKVEYQPQVEIASGRIVGVEALLRWEHPRLGRVSPARFIPLAEQSGAIIPMGIWVLRTACEHVAAWRGTAGGEQLRVAVNLSAHQFLRHDLPDEVAAALHASGLPPQALELELTESVLISDTALAVQRLTDLRDAGVRTSVDDFGTGYSSLNYLRRLPLDVLKIDRTFIADMGEDARAQTVTAALVQLGRSLSMEVIAEGVETAAHARELLALGCPHAQGYFYSAAVPRDRVSDLVTRGFSAV